MAATVFGSVFVAGFFDELLKYVSVRMMETVPSHQRGAKVTAASAHDANQSILFNPRSVIRHALNATHLDPVCLPLE